MNVQISPQPHPLGEVSLERMDKDLISAFNRWRMSQDPALEPKEAVQRLLRIALQAEGAFTAGSPSTDPDPEIARLIDAFRDASQKRDRS